MDPFDRLLQRLEATLRDFEEGAEKAVPLAAGAKGHVWRMPVQDIHHAILLKLMTLLSALNAARILSIHGFVMEPGVIERVADEASEDITFLAIGLSHGLTDHHSRFLYDFWAEDSRTTTISQIAWCDGIGFLATKFDQPCTRFRTIKVRQTAFRE